MNKGNRNKKRIRTINLINTWYHVEDGRFVVVGKRVK